MSVILGVVLLIVSYLIGSFGFSNIFLCGLFAIPTLKNFKKVGFILPETPIYRKYLTPIIFWVIILCTYICFFTLLAKDYFVFVLIGLIVSALVALFRPIPDENTREEFLQQIDKYIIDR